MARQHLSALGRVTVPAAVVGVYDAAPGRAAEFAREAGVEPWATIDDLLRDARPDIVHVCTPPAAHYDAALAALERGAHVYVEKPFALRSLDAERLLQAAASRGRLVCAGHQLLRDRAFEQLMTAAGRLGDIVQIDSHFAFRPVGPPSARTGPRALAAQIVDVLPHPLYILVDALERCAPRGAGVDLAWAEAGPADLQAVLRSDGLTGRLSVSLRARPIASWLSITGTRGSLTCDFVRSTLVGSGNAGTEALEKILNPFVEAGQLMTRTAASLARRMRAGGGYPGLAELIDAFYRAVWCRGNSPVTPSHLLRVAQHFETLVARVAAASPAVAAARRPDAGAAPPVVVTGARGFLGAHIAHALGRARGIGRGPRPAALDVDEWISADLSGGLAADALAGAGVVVHAAAETSGGYDAHQRNTIDATRHLLSAMREAGVSRLVLVSTLSVLRPPRSPWERQHERTPRPGDPRPFGAYAWGKTLQEALVEREAAALGIETRIVRPGALIDWNEPEVPGLMGRHLFGRWHLGLGRPGLPIAVCDVVRCARAIAWCAEHFDRAPHVVNLFDPALTTRGRLVQRLREDGWAGRMVWVPISLVSLGTLTARTTLAVMRGGRPARLAVWSILRPRRYDPRVAASLLDAVKQPDIAFLAP